MLSAATFTFVCPDHMEGKAEGASDVQILCFAVLLIWAPCLAAKVGPLVIQKKQDSDSGQEEIGQVSSEAAPGASPDEPSACLFARANR